MDKVTLIRLVLSMCLVETDKTLKEVWSWVRNAFKSDLETFLISVSPLSSFWGVFAKELKQGVVLPLDKII